MLPPLILLGVLFVFRGWNVVWGDDVSMCPVFDKLYHSTLTFHDLWEPYQGHRVFFHRCLELGLGWFTHWNTYFNVGFVYLSFLADFCLLGWLLQDLRFVLPERTRLLLLLVTSLSIFSTNQAENWCNGWQMGLALSTLCVLCGLVLLAKYGAGLSTLILCTLAGVVATYSFGSGLTYWGALVPLLYVKLREDRLGWVKGMFWAAVTIVVIVFYFHGMSSGTAMSPMPSQDAPGLPQRLGRFFYYWLTCSGAGVFFLNGTKANLSPWMHRLVAAGAPVCGFAGLTAFAVVVWRLLRRGDDLPRLAPWLALGLYGLFSVGVTCLARYTAPVESAISSRYITYSQYVWLALFVLLALLTPHLHKRWWQGIGIILASCYVVSYANGLRGARATSANLQEVRLELLSQPTAHTYHVINTDRDPAQVISFVEIMRRDHLALFHDAPAHASP